MLGAERYDPKEGERVGRVSLEMLIVLAETLTEELTKVSSAMMQA